MHPRKQSAPKRCSLIELQESSMQVRSALRSVMVAIMVAVGLSLTALAAMAGEVPFDKAKFDAAIAQGKPVIVDFAASWCPTCKEQKPIVQGLLKQPKLQPVTLFLADYDTEVALKKQLGVTMQSTFVVFKEGKEVGRATGQTQKEVIGALFDKAL
jgi:thioredoxin 1